MAESKNWNQDVTPEFEERVVQVSRITKVVKGGKRSRFRALIVVGKAGKVGIGLGKSGEVPVAIRKAVERAKKSLVDVCIVGGTIPHQVIGVFGASRVLMKPARSGTGVVAGGSVRTLLELAGVRDVVAKSLGSGNPLNTALATLSAFRLLRSVDVEAKVRGKVLGVRSVGLQDAVTETGGVSA